MTDLALYLAAWSGSPVWYKRTAAEAVERGHFEAIADRADPKRLYLLRVWLSAPRLSADGGFRSESSLLLHYIAKADADGALHDHPWDFRTRVLSGGYTEELPAFGWQVGGPVGPAKTRTRLVFAGETLEHSSDDLHRIKSVRPDTWTLVETGPRVRSWGFHPAGQPWQEFQP